MSDSLSEEAKKLAATYFDILFGKNGMPALLIMIKEPQRIAIRLAETYLEREKNIISNLENRIKEKDERIANLESIVARHDKMFSQISTGNYNAQ